MRLIWTESDLIGSKIIKWGLETDCSHFAVVFDEDYEGNGVVLHSSSKGIDIDWLGTFCKKNRITHALRPRVGLSLEVEEAIYQRLIKKHFSGEYDYPALCWWILWALTWKIFGIRLPARNGWQAPGDYLCTEVAPYILLEMGIEPPVLDYAMIKPHDLFGMLVHSVHFEFDDDWATQTNLIYG